MLLKDEWSEGYQLASAMNFHFHQSKGIPLPTIITTVSENGVNLMGYFFIHDLNYLIRHFYEHLIYKITLLSRLNL